MAIQMQGSLPSKFKLFELYIYIYILLLIFIEIIILLIQKIHDFIKIKKLNEQKKEEILIAVEIPGCPGWPDGPTTFCFTLRGLRHHLTK
jgi:hypothetical protein